MSCKSVCFDLIESDLVAAQNINAAVFSIEPSLYGTKWWDYRMMHPTQATYHFYDAYRAAFAGWHRRNTDYRRAPFISPIKFMKGENKKVVGKDPLMHAESKSAPTGIRKARQQADKMGIPYPFYCEEAIAYAEEHMWTRPPRPTHLALKTLSKQQMEAYEGRLSMVEYIAKKWAEKQSFEFLYSTSPHYHADHNQNLREQVEHRQDIMTRLRDRSNSHFALHFALYKHCVLIESECIEVLGEKAVFRAKHLL